MLSHQWSQFLSETSFIFLAHAFSLLGGSDYVLSSQTAKLMAGTKFSDYLVLKHYKKENKKHFNHLDLAYWPQNFSTHHTISP